MPAIGSTKKCNRGIEFVIAQADQVAIEVVRCVRLKKTATHLGKPDGARNGFTDFVGDPMTFKWVS